MSKPFYVAPLTGNENHVSANELLRHRMTQSDILRHKTRIKNMKPSIDNKPPQSSQLKHLVTNRKKKEIEFQRYSEIERENYRLLDKMSKIMVRGAANSVFGVHNNLNCPALDGEKARTRKTRILLEENQVMLRRILQTKPYYSTMEWDRHTEKTDELMGQMCRFPVRLAKGANRPDSSLNNHDTTAMSDTASQASSRLGSSRLPAKKKLAGGHAAQRKALGGSVSAPPGKQAGGAKGSDEAISVYADDFEDGAEDDVAKDEGGGVEGAGKDGGGQVEGMVTEGENGEEIPEEGGGGEGGAGEGGGEYADESFEAEAE